jgi:hypothetical protein
MSSENEWIRMLFAPVAATLLLASCNGTGPTHDAVSLNAPQGRPSSAGTADNGTGVAGTGGIASFQGTLQAINRGSRQVTVLLDDGKVLVKVNVAKDAGDLGALTPGSRVSFTLRESVSITQDHFFHPETGHVVNRYPPGSMSERELTSSYHSRSPTAHHDMHWAKTIDVPTKVVSVDPDARVVQLVTYDGRHFAIKVSNPRVNLADLSAEEPIVAHFTEIDELHLAH